MDKLQQARCDLYDLRQEIHDHDWPKRLPNRTTDFIAFLYKKLAKISDDIYVAREELKKAPESDKKC